MTEASALPPALDPADVDGVIQAVRFELYRENIYGGLEMLEAAQARRSDPRYAELSARIRSWLGHLASREAYIAAQEEQYKGLRWKMGLKLIEKRLRMLTGKKTRKMVERRGRDPEFQELERAVEAVKPKRVRDVDATIRSIMTVLRPGGRFCFVVPMHEFRARGPIPDYQPVHGYADHCRVFSETELRRRFGNEPGFHLAKIPGAWKHGEIP